MPPQAMPSQQKFEENKEYEMLSQADAHTKLYQIAKNAPPAPYSEGDLVNWALHSYGSFHVAYHHGW